MIKICKFCGQPFETNYKTKKFCNRPHFKQCERCGKTFQILDIHYPDRFCSAECRNIYSKEKREATTLARYGVKNAGWTAESQEKIKAYNLAKYGTEWSFQAEEVKEKIKQTNLERYGVKNANQCEAIRQKAEATNLERYGDRCTLGKNSSLRPVITAHNLEKYGTIDPGNLPEFREKGKQTSLKKYGVEYYMQTDESKQRVKQRSLDKYGVEHFTQSIEVKKKQQATLLKRYGISHIMQSEEFKQKISDSCQAKFGVAWYCMRPECLAAQGVQPSKLNLTFGSKLKSIGLDVSYEYHIGRKSYDIRIENSNILIEIDPTYTHTTGNTKLGNVAKSYHKDKSKIAEENDFRCIHVFDWDNADKIVKLLCPKTHLYARRCELREVTEKETNEFLMKYHLQDSCKGQSIRLGLYHNNELVQLMTFGQPRYNSKFEWELLRLCTKFEYEVIGGSKKLFSNFIRLYYPQSIVSYCDKSKFSGSVYTKLNFKLGDEGEPSIHWSKGSKHITDNLLRQRGYDQLFNTSYGKGTSNEELMLSNGWLPVADCGQSRYEWRA